MKLELLGMKALAKTLPLYGPLLRKMGGDVDKLKEAFLKIDDLERQTYRIMMLPDRFNDIFVERGFIAFEMLNVEIMEQAISIADAGDLNSAEDLLISYFEDHLESHLNWMMGIKEAKKRRAILDLARVDHVAGRYHASVPVILMMIDGMVNAYHPQRMSLSSNDGSIDAWDSVSTHSTGLGRYLRKFRKTRRVTRDAPITFPFRNGIMHGMDLGYSTKAVSVKCWALLFSLREWLLRAQNGDLEQKEQPPTPSLGQTLKKIQSLERDKVLMAAWMPRDGKALLTNIEPNTPEGELTQFLNYILKRNFGFAANYLARKFWKEEKSRITALKNEPLFRNMLSYEIISIQDEAPATTAIEVAIRYRDDRGERVKVGHYSMHAEDQSGEGSFWGKPDVQWRLFRPSLS